MSKKRSAYVLPVVVLLFLSLITTASTVGTKANAQSGVSAQQLTVYIQSLTSGDGSTALSADEIEWYQGAEATEVFAQREPEAAAEIGGPPDDYYIVNDSDSLTDYPVAATATVTLQIYDHTGNIEDLDINWNEQVTLEQFVKLFSQNEVFDLSQSPYHITVQDGQITSFVQQYTP
ncbi:hypothetical protein [Paenibacillus donghaensis]|uniref:Uncharacterized protein n=1 Tax=Paenibacillus donghaensis TaxID=414771 RepID=A0A2Z2K5Q1_9BACL|nr:hypothetical protein [Paenibacillus donghaensis]ASA19924.1 hypothetical protein B9T62_03350 [Paenibacillus donghaensis]